MNLLPSGIPLSKRLLDLFAAVIGLVLVSPVLLVTALLVGIFHGRPVLFRQMRPGYRSALFTVYKFRTMNDSRDWQGNLLPDEQRLTRLGRILRATSLDELPELINVLKGEMSLVGPRPERPYFVETLSKEIPYYQRRLKVRPGITGWAQVKHKYDESIEDVKIKLRYDLFYIENMSLRMDFKILTRTIFVVIFGQGHYN